MIERQIEIATASGPMNTFICHPERSGPHPVVLFYMDAPGIREELRDMARRLGTVGYYVMLPNLYHRAGVEEMGPFVGEAYAATREKIVGLREGLTIGMVMQDTDALVAFADGDVAAARGPMGCVGYCMSGQYALSAAARYPTRMAAAASFYGTHLITDQPDSPDIAVRKATAEIYVCCAEIDHFVPLETVAPLRQSLRDNGVDAEVELFEGIEHGFAFPGRKAYDKHAAERHWERLFALFGRKLGRASKGVTHGQA